MYQLQNYSCGKWVSGNDQHHLLYNAINGDTIASVSSDGLDFNSMANYAREKAGLL